MATVFSAIIAGSIPGTFVWRDEICVAFLSINPIAPGHTLVVPRAEVDHWIDLPADTVTHLHRVGQIIGKAQMRAFPCERIGTMIAGFEVPHTHLHVIPTRSMRDLSFANAAASISRDELDAAATALRGELRRAGYTDVE
jgi:histidine triad (HIT) family protein